MAELAPITDFTNKYSDNLLSVESLLNTTPTVSFVGDGSYEIDNYSDELDYSKYSKSFIYNSGNVDFSTGTNVAFNLGDALKYTTLTSQDNLFQFSICPLLIETFTSPIQLVTFKVNVLYGVTLLDTFEMEIDISTLIEKKHYTYGFTYNVPESSNVNFTFEINNDGFGVPEPNYILGFSGFKVEVDDRDLSIPTPYSPPVNYFIPSQGTTESKVSGNIEMEAGVVATLPQHLVTKSFVETPENQTQSQRSTSTSRTENVTNNGRNTVFIHDAVALALTLTINLPSSPVNDQIVTLNSVLGVTTLTLATFLGTIVGGVTSLVAGVSVRYMWIDSENKWYKI